MAAVLAAGVVLMEYLTRSAQGQPTDDLPPVPEETQSQIRDLVEAWRGQTDDQFWGTLAAWLEQHPDTATIADQILFMNYTIELCPPPEPFLWDSEMDKASIADGMVTTSRDGADLPGLYRGLTALRYKGAPLPRAAAADALRLALAWIAQTTAPVNALPPVPAPLGDPGAHRAATGIPVQLRPQVYIEDVAPGIHPDAYARTLQLLLRPAGISEPAVLAAAAVYQQPATSPYQLLDAEAQIATLPAGAQPPVRTLMARLASALEAVYPLPAGETVTSSQVSCLSVSAGQLPAGTVVYVRRTERATVQFALPHITVDPLTGRPRLSGLDGPAVAPARPPVMIGAQDAFSIALGVAANLAWVMPPPWGPVAAASLNLIELLMGQGNALDEFTQVGNALELFIQQRDVNNDATHIKGLADWLQQQADVLDSTNVDNSGYITSALLPELRKMVAPGDESVYNAIYDLESNLTVEGAFGILVLGVTIYLLTLKMIVQLDAQLAATAKAAGDDATFAAYTDLWLADYTNFLTAINGYSEDGVNAQGWAVRVSNHISDFVNARLGQITEPYRYNNQYWEPDTNGYGYWVDNWGWTYKDVGAGDTDSMNFVADTFTGGDCCTAPTTVEHQDVVQQARDQHVTAVGEQLDATYSDAVSTVQQWIAMIQQWNEHLPPNPPASAPAISGWNGTAPQGNWTDGSAVAYTVAFANTAGPSQVGPWSEFTPTTTNAFPTLSELPVDPLEMSTNRWIYRQFRQPDGSLSPIRIVGITDANATAYQDMQP